MSFLFIISIITLLVLYDKYKQLKRENDILRKNASQQKSSLSFCPKCGENLLQYSVPTINNHINTPINTNVTSQPIVLQNKVNKEITKLTSQEQKNNMILITGAILIVLSAIIFLLSTWSSTGNITKTLIIFLMLIIFFIISRISEKVFHLKQTSEVFFYITLCYLPIALLSISLFGLFGHYLSIFGSGRFIYFSIAYLTISLIYMYVEKTHKTILLKIFKESFLFLTITFASLAIKDILSITSPYIYSFSILIYTIIREYISIKTNNKEQNIILFTMLLILTTHRILLLNTICKINNYIPITFPIYITLILFNTYIYFKYIINKPNIYNYIYPITTIIIFTTTSNLSILNLSLITKEIIVLLSIILISTYDLILHKSIKIQTIIPITLTTILLCLNSYQELSLSPIIILTIYLLLSIINYLVNNKYKDILSYLITIPIILLSISVYKELDLSLSFLLIIPTIFLSIIYFIPNIEDNLKKSTYIIGLISLLLETLYITIKDITYLNNIIILINAIILFLLYIKNNKENNKLISYTLFTLSLLFLLENIGIEDSLTYGISISTISITIIESIINRLETKNTYIYIIISSIISMFILNIDLSILKTFILFLLNISLIIYNIYKLKNNNIYYLLSLSLIPSIYLSDIFIINNLNIMIFISIIIISITTYISYLHNKLNQFTYISYTYILLSIIFLDLNKYIDLGMILIPSIIHILSTNNKTKDIFKFLTYTSLLFIIRNIFDDLNFLSITTINIGSILLYIILLTRTIISKYFNEYKFIEYFSLTIINIIAIFNYTNELDGIIYVSLLIALIIIGYTYKYGPIFLTSLIFVILNAIILTREFWLSIPWWIYVLGIGIILVTFAIRNEAHNNESKHKLEEIKKSLDL